MIVDQLTNASLYTFPNAGLTKGLQFLQTPGNLDLAPGRYEIDGDKVFALVQEYNSRLDKDCFWEAHRKYIDIQFIAKGIEQIGYAPLATLSVTQPYDEKKDVEKLAGTGTFVDFTAGTFGIYFPHDAHMPCRAKDQQQTPVKKIVIKVAV